MNTTNRRETMAKLKRLAKLADEQGDAVSRRGHADTWILIATASEMARAPQYMTWTGRN